MTDSYVIMSPQTGSYLVRVSTGLGVLWLCSSTNSGGLKPWISATTYCGSTVSTRRMRSTKASWVLVSRSLLAAHVDVGHHKAGYCIGNCHYPPSLRPQTFVLLIAYLTLWAIYLSHLVRWPVGLGTFHPYSCCQVAIPKLPSLLETCFTLINTFQGN